MEYAIKKLADNDLEFAKQLILFWQVDDGILNPVIPSDGYLADLLSKDSFHLIVALDGDLVIGGISGYELPMYKEEVREMFLYEIAVHPEYRQRGIARKLIEALRDTSIEKGITIMFVGTSSDNDAAINLYKKTGGDMEVIPWFTYDFGKETKEK